MIPLVLTILGPNHPSTVTQVSSLVAAHGGNGNASRLVTLAGRFAGVVKVTVPEKACCSTRGYGCGSLPSRRIVTP